MPTTTNFGWTTPADTDLVKDGAAAIRTLAGNIDTSLVDLKGGTTGQVLTKASGTDLDFNFTTITAAPSSAIATVATSQTTTSSTYTDLSTSGPAVTFTTGTKALVLITIDMSNSGGTGATSFASYAVSGATTISASDTVALRSSSSQTERMSSASRPTLTAGSNTFTMKYKCNSDTSTFANREIIVIDLGS